MTEISERPVGTCFSMCPEKELLMKEREGLLHKFEIDESTRNRRKPKADSAKVVKSFYRPAAGRLMIDLGELRPAPVLITTINYLFTKVATRSDCDWITAYDYIFDRLRAIRQDIVIQRMDMLPSIYLLERIVKFHAYSAQRLCERTISEYDPVINMQHLLECMDRLLVLYDEYEEDSVEFSNTKKSYCYNRAKMEALNILLHLGKSAGLKRGFSLSPALLESKDVRLAMKISFSWYLGNYVRTCRLMQKLPLILKCGVLCNLQHLRRKALEIMSSGYSSKNLTFPGLKLQQLLLYGNIGNVKKDCELFQLEFSNENVRFQKSTFQDSVKLAAPEALFSERELHKLLPEILLE